ncbi:M20/M25/M40 family metallo-hydrolase [Glycomyces artemisiae]|uniref:Acetylornithine deacetylase/succinyl-diaminopimelate desuccinylase-like protein n=1 Tax=Glycomyces artemisiae TaxID=1076443 RepID=A0A2T0UA27_9ACTN|nr:M20/M25/M40 family metallo-hydrolase [Glycomyces artemisiae]PRY54780.1 acetylornithine deacetylase/succinyl-diaminopimelate desuccinylase-like protein [Glycomyces artemisiae]
MADAQALEEVVAFTRDLIRFDTTNLGGGDGNERAAAEFAAERLAEAGLEPAILEKAPNRSNVVARLEGTDPEAPALLVHGHLDVVPAAAADWSVDPFGGEIDADGMLWGRGAIDMKGMDAMMLAAVRSWAREGVRPRRSIVFAFVADEEAEADFGSRYLAEEHAEKFEGCTEGISESGGFTFHSDGMRIYPIAAGERGTAWLELTARGRAGHGSKRNPDNAVSKLAAAVARIGAHEWPLRVTPVVEAAVAELAALHGVEPDYEDLSGLGAAAQLVESTLRNSANPTVLEAGYKVNVIPEHARAEVDGRVVPGGEAEFEATMDGLCGPDVQWRYAHRSRSLAAPVDSPTFAAMRAAILKHDPEGRPVPFCMSGGTDAKEFSRLGITGYGFSPLALPPEFGYGTLAHGVDERVPVEGLRFGLRVLDDFLLNA